MVEQVVAEHVVVDQVGNEEVMADLNVQSEQVMAEHIVGNAQGGQREAVAEEIPVNTQPCEELTDDELLRLFDCPILGIPNIGVHSVRVDPLLTVGDNIIANSLTNAQNMAVDTSQMEIIPSSQLQFQEMDNTSHQQQEQKSTKRKHKSKETKSLGLTKSRTTVAKDLQDKIFQHYELLLKNHGGGEKWERRECANDVVADRIREPRQQRITVRRVIRVPECNGVLAIAVKSERLGSRRNLQIDEEDGDWSGRVLRARKRDEGFVKEMKSRKLQSHGGEFVPPSLTSAAP
nr:hypothetical protein Iba_chr02eCG9910 [Ipomoea batatas]